MTVSRLLLVSLPLAPGCRTAAAAGVLGDTGLDAAQDAGIAGPAVPIVVP